MKREYKFRIWSEKSGMEVFDWLPAERGFDHWMQFTGFKIGEKELFEGDILLYSDTESEYVDVGIGNVKVAEQEMNSFWPIEFKEGEFGFEVKGGEVINEGWISLRNFFEDYVKPDKCEIIGNIYENEDLIV
jgi:uncharacterized phage protein (TIGR01671 family)